MHLLILNIRLEIHVNILCAGRRKQNGMVILVHNWNVDTMGYRKRALKGMYRNTVCAIHGQVEERYVHQ